MSGREGQSERNVQASGSSRGLARAIGSERASHRVLVDAGSRFARLTPGVVYQGRSSHRGQEDADEKADGKSQQGVSRRNTKVQRGRRTRCELALRRESEKLFSWIQSC